MMNCFCGIVDQRKAFTPYFHPGPLSEILTITNLRHAASRIWTCAESEFRLCWTKFCSSYNHYTKVRHIILKYQEYERDLNMSGIKYSVDIKDIGNLNIKTTLVLIVLIIFTPTGCEDKKIFPLSIIAMAVARYHVNLLYITAGETSHYVLVTDLSRLVSRQHNNHKDKKYFCQYCLHGCSSEEVLKKHLERCRAVAPLK